MSDLDVYISVASNMQESSWSNALGKLDKETFEKLKKALDTVKDVSETKDEEPLATDTATALKQMNEKLNKLIKGLNASRKRFDRIDARLSALESASANGSFSPTSQADDDDKPKSVSKPKSVVKNQNSSKADSGSGDAKTDDDTVSKRKHQYRFGSRQLLVIKPSVGYPTPEDRKKPVEGNLELSYAHGYFAASEVARQNLYLTEDGTCLIYYLAAICVVFDYKKDEQRFFTKHNDDITTICMDPRSGSTLVASGQKDPKDRPGQGKDLPKIWIWDYRTMKGVQLIDNVCWGKISIVQWSPNGYLYCITGDEDQTLKAWDPEEFKGKGNPPELLAFNTMKEQILGFKISPYTPKTSVDEMIMFGKRKFSYVVVTKDKNKLAAKLKSPATLTLKKEGENAFTCCEFFPDGTYAVGSSSGCVYLGKGANITSVVVAHAGSVGDMIYDGQVLITSGFDRLIKKFALESKDAKKAPADKKQTKEADKKDTKSKDDKKEDQSKKTDKKKGDDKGSSAQASDAENDAPTNSNTLVEKWHYEVSIPHSDFILQPRAMALDNKNNILFVGTKTNQVMKFDIKDQQAEIVVDGHDGAINGLCTHPTKPLFATGGYDNAVKIWDAHQRKCLYTHEFEKEHGDKVGKQVVCAAWSPNGNCLVFGTEDSCIGVFTFGDKEPRLQFQQIYTISKKNKNAAIEAVQHLRFNDDGTLLACSHMDSNLYIFGVEGGQGGKVLLQQWEGLPHIAAPTHAQWTKDSKFVKTITRDYEIVHWKIDAKTRKGTFIPQIPDPDKVEWTGDPLLAGWDVQGLYQPGFDGTDLNDASITSDRRLVMSGDDYGTVRVHNYPAIDPTNHLAYGGHAEFVQSVQMLRDDSFLISVGGEDMAIFQWKLFKK